VIFCAHRVARPRGG
jgi:hypothetical protein